MGDRAGEGAALVAEKLGFEQAGGNGGAVDPDESAFAARAEIVNGAGDDFLAGAGFAEDQDGGGGGSGELDLGESAAKDGAFADNFVEAEFGADFFLEIKLFDGELVLERIDLLEGEGIFEGDGDLRGDLLEQLDIGSGEGSANCGWRN